MTHFSIAAFINQIDWSTSTQWYMNHMSMFPFFRSIHLGTPLGSDAWQSAFLITCHLAIIIYLLDLLYREHKAYVTFIARVKVEKPEAPEQVITPTRTAKAVLLKGARSNVVPVPKVSASRELKLAYGQHRMGMYEEALEHYRVAALGTPDDINTHLVGIKIQSEMMIDNAGFTGFLRESLLNFKHMRPSAWRDVTNYIEKVSPRLLSATELKL